MFRYINHRTAAALVAFVVVLSNILVPAGQAFAAKGTSTYQEVWCQTSANGWKIKIGSNSNNQNRYALIMTDAIRNLNNPNIDATVTNGQQVMDSSQSDQIDANFCAVQFALSIPTPTVTGICGLNNDTVTVPDNTNYTWSFSGWTNSQGTVTVTANSPYAFTDGNVKETISVSELDVSACVIKITQLQQITVTIPVPPTPSVSDPCGLNNATWIVPADTTQYTWSLVNGDLVATTTQNFVFANGQTTVDFGVALDSGKLCRATPTPVTFTDVCGVKNDSFTIPSVQGVIYEVNGQPTTAGTYSGTGKVVIIAVAAPDYRLTARYSQTIIFSRRPCRLQDPTVTAFPLGGCVALGSSNGTIAVQVSNPNSVAVVYKAVISGTTQTVIIPANSSTTLIFNGLSAGSNSLTIFQHRKDHDDTILLGSDIDDRFISVYSQTIDLAQCLLARVSPATPTFYDYCGNATDYVYIPSQDGVTYELNGVSVSSGFHAVTGTVTVTAAADQNQGYVLTNGATTTWNFTLIDATCITITKTFVSFTDTNSDGRTDYGDTANWLITVTNNANPSNLNEIQQSFDVQVTDPSATTLENSGVVMGLAPGQSVGLTATTLLSASTTGTVQTVCTASNTAAFTANQVVINDEEFLAIGRQSPQLTGSVDATANFTCPQDPGVSTPRSTPPELPHTGPEDLNLLPLGIIVAIIVYGAVYFAQPKKWYGQQ